MSYCVEGTSKKDKNSNLTNEMDPQLKDYDFKKIRYCILITCNDYLPIYNIRQIL